MFQLHHLESIPTREAIVLRRTELGLTLSDVAKDAGIGFRNYAKIERNELQVEDLKLSQIRGLNKVLFSENIDKTSQVENK